MVTMTGIYEGDKHCTLTHGPSNTQIHTDAPKDNNGRGEAFSPTDLVGAALGSCILTTMAIYAEKNGIDIKGASFQVTKKMKLSPRMIAELEVAITLPAHLTAEQRPALEEIAHTCPVTRSLNSEVKIPVTFTYQSF
ncbi:OsmC family peroxiredoxin [Bacteriovorax stolpii]|uniref:Osmotically inducible protein OsmC n=1 Tax=Bacteriovorax stolpii TaxID=960 RepID=A0A2K9NMP8_BACTC|nr:OsmC family protein [Bacteriovorax stolpii]AUN96780.1 osmotically inducible protein OsmC [Bacteriovorax stolpii]QDK43289.1 OsmC family peroxiredoxin [Bacteriovorax stolpii]TDP53056.1 putative OsmC-like protein [Bacteriovorax stolpii]